MTTRLFLISHAATPAMRQGRFPDDDPLDDRGWSAAAAWKTQLPVVPDAVVRCSPSASAVETALALGIDTEIDHALRETDFGAWRGQKLIDIAKETPAALQAWTRDPAATPPGGESFEQVAARVSAWMTARRAHDTVIAITHASVIRAAVLAARQAPLSSFSRTDVPPLTLYAFAHSAHGWALLPG